VDPGHSKQAVNASGRLGGALLVTLALALGTSGSALGAPLGQTGEFPTTTTASGPEGIAAGPDGNLWFAEAGANKIAEIDPLTHAVTEFSSPTG
jgi:DNA-binding beta-propeller fold protein YncE